MISFGEPLQRNVLNNATLSAGDKDLTQKENLNSLAEEEVSCLKATLSVMIDIQTFQIC